VRPTKDAPPKLRNLLKKAGGGFVAAVEEAVKKSE
jgi:hypothetical protein